MPCTAFDVDLDGFSVLDIANVTVELDIEPVPGGFVVQVLELADSLVLAIQLVSILGDLAHDLVVRIYLRLQSTDLSGVKVGANAVVTGGLLDLIEAPLESTNSANSNEVLGCTASVLVVDGGVLAKDVAIGNSVDLVSGIAILVLVLVEPEGKSALGIFRLHLLSGKGNAEKSSKETPGVVGGIGAADMAHESWTERPHAIPQQRL
jgi:hypothetical protein